MGRCHRAKPLGALTLPNRAVKPGGSSRRVSHCAALSLYPENSLSAAASFDISNATVSYVEPRSLSRGKLPDIESSKSMVVNRQCWRGKDSLLVNPTNSTFVYEPTFPKPLRAGPLGALGPFGT